MARTMDQVEQIAVTLLALSDPSRPTLAAWVQQIVDDTEFAEIPPAGVLDAEMHRPAAEFVSVSSHEDAVEVNMADHRISALAAAVVVHRHGGSGVRLGLSLQARTSHAPTGLAASIVEYTASLGEAAARMAEHLADAR